MRGDVLLFDVYFLWTERKYVGYGWMFFENRTRPTRSPSVEESVSGSGRIGTLKSRPSLCTPLTSIWCVCSGTKSWLVRRSFSALSPEPRGPRKTGICACWTSPPAAISDCVWTTSVAFSSLVASDSGTDVRYDGYRVVHRHNLYNRIFIYLI